MTSSGWSPLQWEFPRRIDPKQTWCVRKYLLQGWIKAWFKHIYGNVYGPVNPLHRKQYFVLLIRVISNCALFVTSPRERLRSIVISIVCLCVCLSARISPEPHARSLPYFLYMLPMSVARSSSGMLMIGRIACRREGDDGSAQSG